MTVREIQGDLHELYRVEVSPDLLSRLLARDNLATAQGWNAAEAKDREERSDVGHVNLPPDLAVAIVLAGNSRGSVSTVD